MIGLGDAVVCFISTKSKLRLYPEADSVCHDTTLTLIHIVPVLTHHTLVLVVCSVKKQSCCFGGFTSRRMSEVIHSLRYFFFPSFFFLFL